MRNLKQTHTYVNLEVSDAAYHEIRELLEAADYHHCINKDGEIDMTGIALVCKPFVMPKFVKPAMPGMTVEQIEKFATEINKKGELADKQ